jgi:hypothetical protein
MERGPSSAQEKERRSLQEFLRQIFARSTFDNKEPYRVVEDEAPAFEQKVLVFRVEIVTAEIIRQICEALGERWEKWCVLLVESFEDGTEKEPLRGLKLEAYLPSPLGPRMPLAAPSPEDEKQTRELYNELQALLAARGKSDPLGKGDYWIIDDGWIPLSHRVSVFDIGFLTPTLARDVQRLLGTKFRNCHIWFQLDVQEASHGEISPAGIRVYPDRIEQDWNLEELRRIFNGRFSW